MIVHRMPQRSEEWYAVRRGKMTASNAQTIANNGKGLETYVYGLLAEKHSLGSEDRYVSDDMLRGVELEELARSTYTMEREVAEEVGFIELDEYVGCSPDGLVGEDGGIEIKCPNNLNYFRLLVDGERAVDTKYLWQVQMCLYLTGRDWWDLVFYNPNFERDILIFRIKPELVMMEKLAVGIEKGKRLIQELEQRYGQVQGEA
jgi:putative phage-type endonuclease